MRNSKSIRYAFSVGAVVAILAGCSAGGSQLAPAGMPQNAVQPGANASVLHSANRVTPDGIIYTPTFVTIENSQYNLDLNNDGTPDFYITESNWRALACYGKEWDYFGTLSVATTHGTGVEGSNGFPSALVSGSPIGQGQGFLHHAGTMEQLYLSWTKGGRGGGCAELKFQFGKWLNVNAYLGLAFEISGQTHYGWAQLRVNCIENCLWLTASLTGYAYQTIAGKSIMAGQM